MSTSFPPSTSTARYSALDHGSPGDLVLNGAPDTDQDPDPDPDESDFEAKGLLASDARSRRGSSATQNHSDIDEIGLTVGKGKGGKKSAGWSSWGTASSAMSDLERKAFVREMTVEVSSSSSLSLSFLSLALAWHLLLLTLTSLHGLRVSNKRLFQY